MGRKRRQSTGEDIMDAVAVLPWWAGLAVAFGSWVLFRMLASTPVVPVGSPAQIDTGFILGMWIRGASGALQYVVPLLCVVGALVSFFRRTRRAELLSTVTTSRSAAALNGMSWQKFETLVAEAFRLQGYEVKEQGGPQADGGVDLVLRKGTEIFLVQCKQWKALKVGVDVVRELYGVMAAQGAAGGFVVTSGRFTDDAVAFAAGRNLRMVDGPKLFDLLQQATTSIQHSRGAPPVRASTEPSPADSENTPPSCPVCSASMVRRTARKGSNAGSQFWGCSAFPACRGTR